MLIHNNDGRTQFYDWLKIAPASNLIVPATPYTVETLGLETVGLPEGPSPVSEN